MYMLLWLMAPVALRVLSGNYFCFVPLSAYSSYVLHNCHQKFPCSTLWHIWDTFTCSIWVIVSLTSCCVHTVFSPTQPAPALLLHAIKHLHCLSPIALLSIVSSATAEMEKNRMFQVRACIELYKGIYRFFCYLLTQLNILFTLSTAMFLV